MCAAKYGVVLQLQCRLMVNWRLEKSLLIKMEHMAQKMTQKCKTSQVLRHHQWDLKQQQLQDPQQHLRISALLQDPQQRLRIPALSTEPQQTSRESGSSSESVPSQLDKGKQPKKSLPDKPDQKLERSKVRKLPDNKLSNYKQN